MSNYSDMLKKDLPEMFKGAPTIEALLEAIGIQLNDVYTFFNALCTARTLETAEGQQLDGIGAIVGLNRTMASNLHANRGGANPAVTVSLIDDSTYREYIRYQIYRMTSGCSNLEIADEIYALCEGYNFYTVDPPTVGSGSPKAHGAFQAYIEMQQATPEECARVKKAIDGHNFRAKAAGTKIYVEVKEPRAE